MLRIGVAACFFHADPQRAIFKGKTLLYLVEDVGRWLLDAGAFPVLLHRLPEGGAISVPEMIRGCDALLLQGGSDVCPASYGEAPLKPEWNGDRARDLYEIALVEEALRQHKPVLGLCRGLQLLNVALGGTLYQDIATQVPGALNHRNWEIYDQNFHQIELVEKSGLAKLYPQTKTAKVNTVHHQAVKTLGKGLRAEAYSLPDRLVEAFRLEGPDYLAAVQWHPEFQNPRDTSLLSTNPLLGEFLAEAAQRKKV